MPAYTLRIRRFDPQSGEAARWEDHSVQMRGRNSVLDAILAVKGEIDGSIGIRCSCQQGICGSCGVRMNGKPGLACNTHLEEAAKRDYGAGWNPRPADEEADAAGAAGASDSDREAASDGEASADGEAGPVITVEPMGNMPVIRDLIVDMDAVHWKKIQRVTPWLINQEPVPEREYIVPHENMVDVTQTMACIQCGACVSDCLSMEVDPLFMGPAALAKAYRFVGDPRDAEQHARLDDLSQDEHGIYDCTHCFNCIDACPKGVNPMGQIMRLRRIAGSDQKIEDRNNGSRHEHAFVKNIRKNGLLHEADLVPDSYGGKFHPRAAPELIGSLPTVATALARGKMTPGKVLGHPHKAPPEVKRIFDEVEGRDSRRELNLYVTGYEETESPPAPPKADARPGADTPAKADAPPPKAEPRPKADAPPKAEPRPKADAPAKADAPSKTDALPKADARPKADTPARADSPPDPDRPPKPHAPPRSARSSKGRRR